MLVDEATGLWSKAAGRRRKKRPSSEKIRRNGKTGIVSEQEHADATGGSKGTETQAATFEGMGLSEGTLEALAHVGFVKPSPFQASFIPKAMTGRDCTGQAHTGTGKTAAFVLPILEAIDHEKPDTQALVHAPTRELADQVKS